MSNKFEQFSHYLLDKVMNDDPKLLEFKIPKSDNDWHKFREMSIGASEVAICLGANPYQILPIMIEEKIGRREPRKIMNESMIAGLIAEEGILERWSYHDGTDTGWVNNWKQKKIRNVDSCDTYIVNTDYPWLFASLDGKAHKNQPWLGNGAIQPRMFPVECKTIKEFEAKKWSDGIPPMYRYQVNAQMLVTNNDVAELATLTDGYSFKIYPFKRDDDACELILSETYAAYELMQQMKELNEQLKKERSVGNTKVVAELEAEILHKMPLPGEQDGYSEYYSQNMTREKETFLGDTNDKTLAALSSKFRLGIKQLEKEQEQIDNLIKRRMTLEKAEYLDLGKNGKLRWYKQGNRLNHQLSFNGYKTGFTEEQIRKFLKTILD